MVEKIGSICFFDKIKHRVVDVFTSKTSSKWIKIRNIDFSKSKTSNLGKCKWINASYVYYKLEGGK